MSEARRSAGDQQPCDPRSVGLQPDAFEAFYREHVGQVQRFVARRVGDHEVAADLTADIFLAVIESAHTYRPQRGSPVAWLFGIARVVVSGERRRQHRDRHAGNRIVGRRLLDAEDIARIEERLEAEAHKRRLYDAMANLPAGQRAVLELVAIDELSVAEAARALGMSDVAARVRLHRARQRMSLALKAADPNPGPTQFTQEAPL